MKGDVVSNNKKKFKSLLNSISNGGAMEGSLQKIKEIFLEDIEDEIKDRKPDFSSINERFDGLLSDFEKALTDKEAKLKAIKNEISSTVNQNIEEVSEKLSEHRVVLDGLRERLNKLDVKNNEISSIVKKSEEITTALLKKGQTKVDTLLTNAFESLDKRRTSIIIIIDNEIRTRKANFKRTVSLFEETINDKFKEFDDKFDKYLEKVGFELFIKYIRKNALRIIWTLFIGIFKRR